jgi:hypothetical protein
MESSSGKEGPWRDSGLKKIFDSLPDDRRTFQAAGGPSERPSIAAARLVHPRFWNAAEIVGLVRVVEGKLDAEGVRVEILRYDESSLALKPTREIIEVVERSSKANLELLAAAQRMSTGEGLSHGGYEEIVEAVREGMLPASAAEVLTSLLKNAESHVTKLGGLQAPAGRSFANSIHRIVEGILSSTEPENRREELARLEAVVKSAEGNEAGIAGIAAMNEKMVSREKEMIRQKLSEEKVDLTGLPESLTGQRMFLKGNLMPSTVAAFAKSLEARGRTDKGEAAVPSAKRTPGRSLADMLMVRVKQGKFKAEDLAAFFQQRPPCANSSIVRAFAKYGVPSAMGLGLFSSAESANAKDNRVEVKRAVAAAEGT